ncbi:hypothetical protein GE061_010105 [Apolygus lucorum]|uniref:Uncharacterized protein n=1 Tax=Apolygus lucorum TaxID=248454 RepID=A0A8S9Y2E2_APOLU|nr:hypothetical protein GE061_010105 [Apolygus lucorum]
MSTSRKLPPTLQNVLNIIPQLHPLHLKRLFFSLFIYKYKISIPNIYYTRTIIYKKEEWVALMGMGILNAKNACILMGLR